MAVEIKEQSQEQKQAVATQLAEKSSDLAQSIIKTLDLPTSVKDAVDRGEESLDAKETVSEASDETSEESNDISSEQTEDTQEKQEPYSVQKRIDELTREKRQLEARLKKLETRSEPTTDPDLEKLQKMSLDELKDTRKKILKAQRTADEATLDQLFDLEEKVNKTIETAPSRFQAQQVERFNEAVSEASDLSPEEQKVVFGHANNIYARTKSFQSSIDGQAEAWNLAVEHYRSMNKLTVGKSKVNELERKVNDLKKKTSLDTAVQKGNTKVSEEEKLYKRAQTGTTSDKEAFFKKRLDTDSLIPEEFRR